MKGKPVDKLIHGYLFPDLKQADPVNFQTFLTQCLIPEVRQEVHAYYGHIDTTEARYPGLDYCDPIHRIRLSRWHWHSHLFRAFDALGLTHSEISRLTKWEGTKWAKERYEREHGTTIGDSAWDSTPRFVHPRDRPRRLSPTVEEAARATADQPDEIGASGDECEDDRRDDHDEDEQDEDGVESSDDLMESVGPTLNERLREQVARREAGDDTAVLDEEWEQWLKNALEAGGFPDIAEALSQDGWIDSASLVPTLSLFPPDILSAAREGRWDRVPESLEPTLRRALEAEDLAAASRSDNTIWNPVEEAGQGAFRQYYSNLRLPGSSNSLRRMATAPWG